MSGEPKWTPGPYSVKVKPRFPFDIEIVAGEEPVVTFNRWAYSSRAKTVEDVMLGVGFDHRKRPEVAAANARQMATVTLMAGSTELYDALVSTLAHLKLFATEHDSIAKAVWDQAEAALAKARGGP